MDRVYEIALLIDFYGQLLTKRQLEAMNLHYNQDLSLGEIAENLGISRQGVYDTVKKGKKQLAGYENKLGLVNRFLKQQTRIKRIMEKVNDLVIEYDDLEKLREVLNELKQLTEEL